RRERGNTGPSARSSNDLPPLPAVTSPWGNFSHVPLAGLSSAPSLPVQYSMAYCVGYGFGQAMPMASISWGWENSTTTHCGFAESGSPVNFELRYGLLFQ